MIAHGKIRTSLLPGILLAGVIAGLLATSAAAFLTARQFYLQRSELRLTPVNPEHFLRENATLGPKLRRRVVFFGDSRINQWQLQPVSSSAELVWRGVDGETTAQMAFRFRQDVTAIQADAVVIQAGINDLVAGAALGRGEVAESAALRHIGAMVDAAEAASVHVYLLTVIRPATPPPWRWPVWSTAIPDQVDRLNAGLKALVGPGVSLIDADHALAGGERALPRRYAADTLHLNAAGYARLNELVATALMEEDDAVQ